MWVRGMAGAGHRGSQGGLSPVQTQRGNDSCAQTAVMSGRRPVVKGCFEAVVNVSSAVMSTACRCGRDVSAGPDDSSAWLFASSFARAPIGADRYSGFQAFSVGSHHFVGALDADRPRRRKLLSNNLVVQAATGRSSYWPPRVISTKTMRATLLASATAVRLNLYLTVLRSSIPLAHRRKASLWPRR